MRFIPPVLPAMALLLAAALHAAAAEPLPPKEARKKVGEEITVEMEVKHAKNALAKRGFIYLDSEEDFKSKDNFAVVLDKKAADKLEKDGIADPAEHFKGKTIRATGKVEIDEEHKLPRIVLDDPRHIKIVEKK